MSLVDNERTKLLASALDRASTACLTVGVLAPIAAAFYTSAGPPIGPLLIGVFAWMSAAGILHWAARWVLRTLRP